MSDHQSFDCVGGSTDGERYLSIADLWKVELPDAPCTTPHKNSRPSNDDLQWYKKSASHWQSQEPTVDGMLGGLGELDATDISGSRRFITQLETRNGIRERNVALDVGAGIGRVTKYFLLPLFKTVDMLEQNLQYLQTSKTFAANPEAPGTVGKRIACGMQHFRADGAILDNGSSSGSLISRYDLIWIQWCIIYLTDDDFVSFMIECGKALTETGVVCVKESVARKGFLVDKDDSSIMRSDKYLKHLFQRAGLEIVRESRQMDFPKDIFPVKTYALRPRSRD